MINPKLLGQVKTHQIFGLKRVLKRLLPDRSSSWPKGSSANVHRGSVVEKDRKNQSTKHHRKDLAQFAGWAQTIPLGDSPWPFLLKIYFPVHRLEKLLDLSFFLFNLFGKTQASTWWRLGDWRSVNLTSNWFPPDEMANCSPGLVPVQAQSQCRCPWRPFDAGDPSWFQFSPQSSNKKRGQEEHEERT